MYGKNDFEMSEDHGGSPLPETKVELIWSVKRLYCTTQIPQFQYILRYSGSHVWVERKCQAKHSAFVVAPQLPELYRWDYAASGELSTYDELAVERPDAVGTRRIENRALW
jgi:hypothetical protein